MLDGLGKMIRSEMRRESELPSILPQIVNVSIFEVRVFMLIQNLCKRQRKLVSGILEWMGIRVREMTEELIDELRVIQRKVQSSPGNVEELTQLKQYVENVCPCLLESKQLQIRECMSMYDILESLEQRLRTEDYQKRWSLFGMPKQTEEIIRLSLVHLENTRVSLLQDMVQ